MSRVREAYDDWRRAEAAARAEEAKLQAAWDLLEAGRALPPELLANVSRARMDANEKLSNAILLMAMAPPVTPPPTPA